MFPLKDNIPTERFPFVTVTLIALNAIAFLLFQGWPGIDHQQVLEYGAIPYEITNPGENCGTEPGGPVVCEGQAGVVGTAQDQPPTWITLFTSMFMHGGLLHIGGNMLFLWIFGNNVEDAMGRVRFVLFYLAGGLAATMAQVATDADATVPSIGASGAVAAVLGGYALLYPRARVVTLLIVIVFITLIELPALLVLALWFLLQLYYGAADLAQPVAGGGGVAYFAHIGGFAFGLATVKLLARHRNPAYDSYNPRPGVY